jgi:hypothetical protein
MRGESICIRVRVTLSRVLNEISVCCSFFIFIIRLFEFIFIDTELYRYFYHHLLHFSADDMELHWYPEMATVDIGGDIDAYLERMSRPHSRIRWDMRTWWFTQQVPGYRFHWNQIDRPIWMALLIRSPQLFVCPNMPIQRFM